MDSFRTLYYVDGTCVAPLPVLVACGDSHDAEGRWIYDNSHFKTEPEAWAWLDRDVKAQISLAARGVEDARSGVRRAEADAADAVVRFKQIEDARKDRAG